MHAHNPSMLHCEVERSLAGPILKREGGEEVVRFEAGQKNV